MKAEEYVEENGYNDQDGIEIISVTDAHTALELKFIDVVNLLKNTDTFITKQILDLYNKLKKKNNKLL